jgi:hypothetical protein
LDAFRFLYFLAEDEDNGAPIRAIVLGMSDHTLEMFEEATHYIMGLGEESPAVQHYVGLVRDVW